MLSADPIGAPSGSPEGAPLRAEPSPAARRLHAALERINAALVRRAEADAALRDRLEHEAAERVAEPDGAAAAELRARVDAAIDHLRAILGEL